jgi:hypothetical protein
MKINFAYVFRCLLDYIFFTIMTTILVIFFDLLILGHTSIFIRESIYLWGIIESLFLSLLPFFLYEVERRRDIRWWQHYDKIM